MEPIRVHFVFLNDRIESDKNFLFQMSVYQTHIEQMESFTFFLGSQSEFERFFAFLAS